MQETKRQKQVARLIHEELEVIFQKEGLNMIDGGMVSIAEVQVTPDLLDTRIFLSFFQVKDDEEAMEKITGKTSEIRRQLGNKLRFNLRRIPHLRFIKDDTLDRVFHLEEIFKKIKEEEEAKKNDK